MGFSTFQGGFNSSPSTSIFGTPSLLTSLFRQTKLPNQLEFDTSYEGMLDAYQTNLDLENTTNLTGGQGTNVWQSFGLRAKKITNRIGKKVKPIVEKVDTIGLDIADNVIAKDYSGPNGLVTQVADLAYDLTSDKLIQSGNPYAAAAGTFMKVAGVTNKTVQNLTGAGTDKMTKADAFLDSNWAGPAGWINGWTGKKTDNFDADSEVWKNALASYTDSESDAMDAADKAGKKYGGFSRRARRRANRLIADARRLLDLVRGITDLSENQRLIAQNMNPANSLAYSLDMDGGYDLRYIRAAKSGLKLDKHYKKPDNWTEEKVPYEEWIKDVNPNFINDNYDLETAYKYYPKEDLERWKFAVNSPDPKYYMDYIDPETKEYIYHLGSIAPLDNGDFIFLKKGKEDTNPELHFETDAYHNGSNGLKQTHDLVFDTNENRYYYRKKHPIKKNKLGGTLSSFIDCADTFIDVSSFIDCADTFIDVSSFIDCADTFIDDVEKFLNGGSVNIIPEGALHARKHNMETDLDITKKGIPVVDNDGNQQAEIERSEIILRLQTTLKIEELFKVYQSKDNSLKDRENAALEAGKLLTYEILYNTLDNTHELL